MLTGEVEERILLITEEGETGKTWFLLKLFHECEERNIPVVRIDFDRRRTSSETNYLGIAHTISRHLGAHRTPHISACEEAISRRGIVIGGGVGHSSDIDFGERTKFKESEIDAAGRDLFQDVSINYAEARPTPNQVAQQRADMGRALGNDLAALASEHGRIVILMDTFEYAEKETCAWLEHWLMEPMRRRLSHVILVVAGQPQCRHFFDRPTLWSGLVTTIDRFSPFEEEDVRAYSRRCNIIIPEAEFSLLFKLTRKGGPSEMAHIFEVLAQTRKDER
jgi:hypothetical protein